MRYSKVWCDVVGRWLGEWGVCGYWMREIFEGRFGDSWKGNWDRLGSDCFDMWVAHLYVILWLSSRARDEPTSYRYLSTVSLIINHYCPRSHDVHAYYFFYSAQHHSLVELTWEQAVWGISMCSKEKLHMDTCVWRERIYSGQAGSLQMVPY
jgi:hypothetical protein